ncbi:helix-hairpin-helix domain-containing protein [Halopelagius longus]|uniref:Helix-hairpin-helix domain-containing protein n=1 Tax=Halopelagius longus TaxID=1236180 RepID=A0A1H0Y5G9_9EURY|nr:helix-hairpin-helix domain-containing protein [Halopelagius longus]RDI72279.1 hypothetical protein DWB78_11475 [Halopelagius longus]SDQ10226.1 Helix-hairpin-helix domain-containing protein [Halopelagius longus]
MSSETDDSTEGAQRLLVHLANGPTVACGNFKAIEEGVLLFEDAERERVIGFVPYGELRFVLPSDADVRPAATNAAAGDESEPGGGDEPEIEVETEVEVEAGDGVEVDVEAETELEREGDDELEVESEVEVEARRTGEGEAETEEAESESDAEAERDDGPATAQFDSGADEGTDDVEVRGAEEAAEAEAHEPDPATESGETGREEPEATSEAASPSQATVESESDASESAGDPTEVGGIGEAYGADLRDAGIDSLAALADASAEDVADAADVSPERAEQWIADAAEATNENAADGESDGTGAEA